MFVFEDIFCEMLIDFSFLLAMQSYYGSSKLLQHAFSLGYISPKTSLRRYIYFYRLVLECEGLLDYFFSYGHYKYWIRQRTQPDGSIIGWHGGHLWAEGWCMETEAF